MQYNTFIPKLQTKHLDTDKEDRRFLAENEARKTLAQIIGGLAILTGLYATNATLQVSADQNRVASQQAELAKQQGGDASAHQLGPERCTVASENLAACHKDAR